MDALVSAGWSKTKLDQWGVPGMYLLSGPWATYWLSGAWVADGKIPYSFSENVSWLRGRHAFKFGMQVSELQLGNLGHWQNHQIGDAATAHPQMVGKTGASLASALLGLPQNVGIGDGLYVQKLRPWAVFAQDEWKLRPNLTLNLGLRYDQFPTPVYEEGMVNGPDFSTGYWLIGASKMPPACNTAGIAPCIPGDGNLSKILYGDRIRLADYPAVRHPVRDNFGPRLGVAWSPGKSLVFRAGYGMVFDTVSGATQEAQGATNTWPAKRSVDTTVNQFGSAPVTLADVQRAAFSPLPDDSPWGSSAWFWDPAKKNAYSHQWNFEVQRQITQPMLVSVAYVGSTSRRLDYNTVGNTARTLGPGIAGRSPAAEAVAVHGIAAVRNGPGKSELSRVADESGPAVLGRVAVSGGVHVVEVDR